MSGRYIDKDISREIRGFIWSSLGKASEVLANAATRLHMFAGYFLQHIIQYVYNTMRYMYRSHWPLEYSTISAILAICVRSYILFAV